MSTEEPVPAADAGLSFDKAEYTGTAPALACAMCGGAVHGTYYEANGNVLCPVCAEALRGEANPRAEQERFRRASGFGLLGALAGGAGYAIITEMSGYNIGLVAIGVAWVVGRGVRHGARGLGGPKFQLLTLALTYLAIAGSWLPRIVQGAEIEWTAAIALQVGWLALQLPVITALEAPMSAVITAFALFEAWRSNAGGVPALSGPFDAAARAGSGLGG